MKIRLITVVWGREFVDLFLTVALRSLLAEGNAPALVAAHDVNYTIYTTPEDAQALQADSAFEKLRSVVKIHFSLFNQSEIDPADPGSRGILWNRGLQLAQRNGEVLFFIMPDVLHARGTLLRWARRFEAGARAVFAIGPRVTLETALPELEDRFPDRASPCDLDDQQLIDLLYRHFHPLHATMRRASERRHADPKSDLRVVPGQGLIAREIVSQPFALDPGFFSELRFFAPEDHLDTLAFEPCSTVSLEPIAKFIDHWYRPWPLDQTRLSNLGGWWDRHSTKSCELESEQTFALCHERGEDGAAAIARARAVGSGRFYRAQIVTAGRLYRLFVELRQHKLSRAAAVLAAAVFAGRLRRRLGIRRRAILLIPVDAALDENWSQIRELLTPGRERDLTDLVSDHVILPKEEVRLSRRRRGVLDATDEAGPERLFTMSGQAAEPLIDAAEVVGTPFDVGPFTIYPIDRVLWQHAPHGVVTADAKQAVHPIRAAPNPVSSFNLIGSGGLRPGPYLNRGRRVLRQMTRSAARHGVSLSIHLLRRIELKMERVPPVGRFARLSLTVLRSIQQHGFAVTWGRAAGRIPVLRAPASLVERMRDQKHRLAGTGLRVVHAVRRDGWKVAMRRARNRLKVAASESLTTARLNMMSSDIDAFNDIRRIRVLQAIEQVLTEFMQALPLDEEQSSPLVLVRGILGQLEKAEQGSLSQVLVARLLQLTAKNPMWSDAWLELGFLHLDAGQLDDALAAFERAMQGAQLKDGDKVNSLAIAAANHGRILAARGRHQEACESFAFCLGRDPGQAVTAVEYAEQLRTLGQLDLAASYYVEGMNYHGMRWNLPKFPRDARKISFASFSPRKEIGPRPGVDVPMRSAIETVD
ncbi:tetratricopeptide repeat protein [Bradyrhizobium sp.]|uniref:tetratricopeptide repeat protein n=1 Tax=Bradyrhizobium sp. TaxID=376 RepID=UPI003C6BCAF3